MKIEYINDGVRAYITHICGHTIPLWFSSRKYAEYHKDSYESKKCVNCQPLSRYYENLQNIVRG